MAGSHIFVMYADGNNNVTISARDGNEGHVEPVFDSTLFAGIELLEGTGISNGVMTANVRCTLSSAYRWLPSANGSHRHNLYLRLERNSQSIPLDMRLEPRQRHRFHERDIHVDPAWSRQHATVHIRFIRCIDIL
jgi:hypothetical protein